MSKLLTKEGYLLNKKKINKKIIIEARKDLTVKPFQAFRHINMKPVEFKVFSEKEYLKLCET